MEDDIDLQEIQDTLVDLAFEAGRMILAANPHDAPIDTKLNSADMVTETDKAVEQLISTRLHARYPSFAFVGEETFQPGVTRIPADTPTFVVDPIDGTTNFIHGFPAACISLGLALRRVPAVGVVYNPFADVLYAGARGHGAWMLRNASLPAGSPGAGAKVWLGGGPAGTPKQPPLGDLGTALVAVEWGSERTGINFELRARVFRALAASKAEGGAMVHSLRSLGSAALNVCAVAAGQVDMYWEGGCWAWDVCAGWCILVEAGGIMVGGSPGEWEPALDGRIYLAVRGAPSGQKEIVEELWGHIGDERMEYTH